MSASYYILCMSNTIFCGNKLQRIEAYLGQDGFRVLKYEGGGEGFEKDEYKSNVNNKSH